MQDQFPAQDVAKLLTHPDKYYTKLIIPMQNNGAAGVFDTKRQEINISDLPQP
jgi:hypothetical protein